MRNLLSKFTKQTKPWNEGIQPKIQSTVYPDETLTYTELFVHIYEQLKPIK